MKGLKTATVFIDVPASTVRTLIIPTKDAKDSIDFRMSISDSADNFDGHPNSCGSTWTITSGACGANNFTAGATGVNSQGPPSLTSVSASFQLDGTYHLVLTRGAGSGVVYCLVQYKINSVS